MIYRQNWLDVRAYLHHCARVKQNDPATVSRYRKSLRHLLEWADEIPLHKARNIDPTFPIYLLSARVNGKPVPLAPASIAKTLMVARHFFAFARLEWSQRYRTITESWMESLHPPRHVRMEARLPVHHFYSLDDVLQLVAVSTETLRQERAKAGACMLFLSGMRAEALASLPISCVDLENNQIMQLPELGVRTKNSKAAITYLLDIPELLDVVRSWDRRVRSLPPSALWYSTITRDSMRLTVTTRAFNERHHVIGEDMKLICDLAGISYLSPHKLRHGHIVYARNLAHDMAQLKAISQNVMHSTVMITDQVYSALTDNQVQRTISSLGQRSSGSREEMITQLIEMLKSQL